MRIRFLLDTELSEAEISALQEVIADQPTAKVLIDGLDDRVFHARLVGAQPVMQSE